MGNNLFEAAAEPTPTPTPTPGVMSVALYAYITVAQICNWFSFQRMRNIKSSSQLFGLKWLVLILSFKNNILYFCSNLNYFSKSWEDPRLSWNISEYDDINEITLPVSKLWVPDIVLQVILVWLILFVFHSVQILNLLRFSVFDKIEKNRTGKLIKQLNFLVLSSFM